MYAEFKHTLRRQRGSLIGWGIGLFLYSLMMTFFYSSVGEMMEQFTELLEIYPKEMLAFFPNINTINTPAGYLDTYFFSLMHLIIGIYTISAFSGLLGKHEEQGVLDLLLSQPVSRTGMFWGRVLGVTVSTITLLLVSWLGWVFPASSVGLGLTWIEFLTPYLPLFLVLVLFGAMALFFSMVLPASRLAGGLAGALLVANFLLVGVSSLNPDVEAFYKLTPLNCYQGGQAVNGLRWDWVAGLLAATLVFWLFGWLLFQHRDIRVGGERIFRLADLKPLKKKWAKVSS